ncbi:alpha/beta hydrolase [Pantoea eucalypti]|uniref:alpha/beta fold hydrolase n=1 Tax=Pantoea eucalypti TaxID=470933 RepID=UPI0024B9B97C|nr:alpha/beta hydrolase [Pantoea eucalypti]MDJ0475195.1 alpha/beta hydrolase [Pantoea eucalypti]
MVQDMTPLVLIPGFMLDETLWDDFIDVYPPGQTFCRVSLGQEESIAGMAAGIVASLPERFVLAGFSLGGYVARAIAETAPEKVAGLILIATSLREDSYRQRERLDAAVLSGEFRGISPAAIRHSLHPKFHDDTALLGRIREMGKRLGPEVFRAQSLLKRGGITVRQLTCPVLIIAAGEDRLRSLSEAAELSELFRCPAEIIEGSGHMIPLEKPRELAQMISNWISLNGL